MLGITKITGLVYTKLEKRDKLILLSLASFVAIADIAHLMSINIHSDTISLWICVLTYLLPWWFIDARFRNILFSSIWLLVVASLPIIIHEEYAYFPIIGFLCFQLLRTIFWVSNKREFIPTMFGYTKFRNRFSKSLNTFSDGDDAVYSVIFFFALIGIISWII